jgi:hypothetical protein
MSTTNFKGASFWVWGGGPSVVWFFEFVKNRRFWFFKYFGIKRTASSGSLKKFQNQRSIGWFRFFPKKKTLKESTVFMKEPRKN